MNIPFYALVRSWKWQVIRVEKVTPQKIFGFVVYGAWLEKEEKTQLFRTDITRQWQELNPAIAACADIVRQEEQQGEERDLMNLRHSAGRIVLLDKHKGQRHRKHTTDEVEE